MMSFLRRPSYLVLILSWAAGMSLSLRGNADAAFSSLIVRSHDQIAGHYCRDMGLVEDLSCEVELHADEIIDIRFNLDDAVSIAPELSSIDSVLGGGEVAFLKRKCGCTVFITHREVARSNRFDGFKQGQAFNHRVKIRSGKPVAVDAVLMENTNETSQEKGVVNENSRSTSAA